ncbi:MAG: ATP synthase subunit I [Armatimonadota bacterium]|nr:ATP synthase subunit I [Armatimonadota bacterium]
MPVVGLDVRFIKRVYRTSVAVWLLTMLCGWAVGSAAVAIGITIGFGISLGSLMLIERLVTALAPDTTGQSKRAVRKLLAVALMKYAFIAAILWAALRSGWASPVGLAIGIGLPQAVIFLKALGSALTFGSESGRGL